MRKLTFSISMILSLFVASAMTAQVRGRGRLQGIVSDATTGKPVAGAIVSVSPAKEQTQPIVAKTDAKGHWSALGLTTGTWNIDITADGYETSRGSASVSELTMAPPINTKMTPAVQQEAPAPEAQVESSPLLPQEAVDAIDEGQNLLKPKVGDVVSSSDSAGVTSSFGSHTVTAEEVKENLTRAIADFEKALPMIPSDKPEAKTLRDQLVQVMAQAYYRAGSLDKAIAMLEQSVASDPANTSTQVLLANVYLENGQLEAGKKLLEQLPPTAISDSNAYINLGILFLNKNNPSDAKVYFGKAIEMSPDEAAAYYYRGIANVQLKQNASARADLEKAVALAAPGSQEAKDAKDMLQGLPRK